eukprot:scaffold359113_cov31-Prasinocladus_malaysianus.AAC.1
MVDLIKAGDVRCKHRHTLTATICLGQSARLCGYLQLTSCHWPALTTAAVLYAVGVIPPGSTGSRAARPAT